MSDGNRTGDAGGSRLSREEVERDYPEQFKSLTPRQSLDNEPGSVCAVSRCVEHVIIKMRRDAAGGCTIYEKYAC